jgi:hypothetical protein
MNCGEKGIPGHLHTDGRDANQTFLATELLYRRFRKSIEATANSDTEMLPPDLFPLRSDSLNRAAYCKPEDVLYNSNGAPHYFEQGICQFSVGCAEEIMAVKSDANGKNTYTLKIVHKPEDCMYPHSEIAVYKDGTLIDSVNPKSVKQEIRQKLLICIGTTSIIKQPL